MTWVDWLILIFIAVGVWQGFWRGLIRQVVQLVGLVAAIIVSFQLFPVVSSWMETQLKLPVAYTGAFALAVTFFALLVAFEAIGFIVQKLFAPALQANLMNRIGGIAVGVLRQVVIASIVVTLLVTLPTSAAVKQTIEQAKLARPLVKFALSLERMLQGKVKDGAFDSLSFRTTSKDDTTTTALNYTVANPTVDLEGEVKLFAATNEIRRQSKQPALVPNLTLQEVARSHARDMLAKGYFSHISPANEDVTKRVSKTNIQVLTVGENLANAATVEIAQAGLLASKAHRENIVSPDYNAVGIAVLDAGKYGKMIVEVFAKTP